MKIEVVFACCFSCELNTTILTEQYPLFETHIQCFWMNLYDCSFVLCFVLYDLFSVGVVIVAFIFIGMLMQNHFLLLHNVLFNASSLIVAIVKLSNLAYSSDYSQVAAHAQVMWQLMIKGSFNGGLSIPERYIMPHVQIHQELAHQGHGNVI